MCIIQGKMTKITKLHMLKLHVKSYFCDHFYIKKWKISTFEQVWNNTNKKIENFWSNNQFFWGLIPFSAWLRTNHYEILKRNIKIYRPACCKLWWSLVIQWFGVKPVWVTKKSTWNNGATKKCCKQKMQKISVIFSEI